MVKRKPRKGVKGGKMSSLPGDDASNRNRSEPPSLLRNFYGEGQRPCSVLVEFGKRLAPATMSFTPPDSSQVDRLSKLTGLEVRPAFNFGDIENAIQPATIIPQIDPHFRSFYHVKTKSPGEAIECARKIVAGMSNDVLDATPVPSAEPALGPDLAIPADIALKTPNFSPLQEYLGPGPDGVNAAFSWQFKGGDGASVTIVDLEGGWRLDHENLTNVKTNLWGGQNSINEAWVEHGTAVVGILAGTPDYSGIVGISPAARVGMISVFEGQSYEDRIANQILASLKILTPGDVLLIELQRPGPTTNYDSNPAQKGYIPVTYWADVRSAVSKATAEGVCVIEVAGNGGESLDDPKYDGKFDQTRYDPGSIMVGAGAPPRSQLGPPRSRLDFSNFGRRIDCQAWGLNVTTSGYGDLWGNGNKSHFYTSKFMGTSSAAPIIAGVVACLQGRHKAVYGQPIPPRLVRSALNNIGWVQQSNTSERIGLQPDLAMLYRAFQLM